MQTATDQRPTSARNYLLRGLAASLALFGLFRLNWAAANVVLPVTQFQAGLAVGMFGTPALPLGVTLECSGADALALCLGAVVAYPVRWPARVAGALGGVAVLLGLNTARIGTLGRVAASPEWFNALHVYLWPAVLTLAAVGYVLAWMRLADRAHLREPRTIEPRELLLRERPQPSRQFVALTVVFSVLFIAASPLYLENSGVLVLAGVIARAAAASLAIAGIDANAAGNILWTPRGSVLVTTECISTPLVPIYLAAVCAYSTTWRRMTFGVLATLPLFVGLGIARLLVVAVPSLAVSPIFVMHAFYQLLLGSVVVYVAAYWQRGNRTALAYAGAGVIAGAAFILLPGPLYTRLLVAPSIATLSDPQGAIALLPAFQIGLFLALWIAAFIGAGWRPFIAGLTLLVLTQTTGLLALNALASHAITLHVRDVRAWAVAGPVLILAMVANLARTRR